MNDMTPVNERKMCVKIPAELRQLNDAIDKYVEASQLASAADKRGAVLEVIKHRQNAVSYRHEAEELEEKIMTNKKKYYELVQEAEIATELAKLLDAVGDKETARKCYSEAANL